MYRPRVIPVLLLRKHGLVKSRGFKDYRYIGDPMNAVKIFNDLRADELIILDTEASRERRLVDLDLVRNVGDEANMPFSVGGGIRTLEDIRLIIAAGAERVIINSAAVDNPDFIRQASEAFGASTVVVCIDVKTNFFGKTRVWTAGAQRQSVFQPVEFARLAERMGAGEIVLQSIDRDGSMKGYDIPLTRAVAEAVAIPVVALGGAGGREDFVRAYSEGYASGVAAGSFFIYHGPKRGVLINYPDRGQLAEWFRSG